VNLQKQLTPTLPITIRPYYINGTHVKNGTFQHLTNLSTLSKHENHQNAQNQNDENDKK